MKQYKSTIKGIALSFIAAFSITSCSEDVMDKVNENPNNAHDVPAKFILSDVGVSTAFNVVGGDFTLYSSVYIEHETGTGQQQWRAETRNGEPTASSTYNNAWLSLYSNIKNAKMVIDKCQNSSLDKGNAVTEAIGHILLAYNAAIATDMFGDTPFSETGIMNEDGTPKYMQPKIDTQEYIYGEVMNHLTTAIELLDGGNAKDNGLSGGIGDKDYFYGGKAEKWLKAAYGLKARYTMHLLNKSKDVTKDLTDVLTYIGQSFESAEDELKLAIYDGAAQNNPTFSFNYSRFGSFSVSESLIEKLNERNDPRLAQSFMDADAEKHIEANEIKAAPNGEALESSSEYSKSMIGYAITAPTQLLSYHELLFIKAEAMARLDQSGVENVLKDAIKAGFENMEVSLKSSNKFFKDNIKGYEEVTIALSDKVNVYYTNNVSGKFTENEIKEIIAQKYLAFYGASGESVEAYNDYRRLKAEGKGYEVKLNNPLNVNKFPHRFGYGGSDVTANKAIKEAFGDGQYVYTEPVWWAGGTR